MPADRGAGRAWPTSYRIERESGPSPRHALVLRALLVAALFGIPWTHLMARLLPDTPHLVLVLLNSLQIGLVLYNLLLALLNRPLLQDTLTATSVRGGQHGVVRGTLNPAWSLVAIALVLAAHLVITIYVHERPLDGANPSRADARRIERAFLEVMDLRTEMRVSRSSRKGELKLLTVRVWLPWAEWRPGLLEDAANIVLLEGARHRAVSIRSG